MPISRRSTRSNRMRRGRGRPRKTTFMPLSIIKRKVGFRANTHFFKRLGQDIALINQPGVPGGAVFWYPNPTIATPTVLHDDLPNTEQTGVGIQFQLDQAIDYTDFTALFDRYKIVGVKLKVMYQCNSAMSAYPGALPIMTYAFDCDDNTSPANKNAVATKLYAKTRVLNANRPFTIFFKPRITKQVYHGGITSGYTSEKSTWIDCSNPDVAHYGMKIWINNWLTDTDVANKLTITPTYYISLKDTQ